VIINITAWLLTPLSPLVEKFEIFHAKGPEPRLEPIPPGQSFMTQPCLGGSMEGALQRYSLASQMNNAMAIVMKTKKPIFTMSRYLTVNPF
jgi:hypothetical protein